MKGEGRAEANVSVYVDELRMTPSLCRKKFPYPQYCHMVADSEPELHRMAHDLGLKRSWFQNRRDYPHYDITASKRTQAVQRGAKEISAREWVERRQASHSILKEAHP